MDNREDCEIVNNENIDRVQPITNEKLVNDFISRDKPFKVIFGYPTQERWCQLLELFHPYGTILAFEGSFIYYDNNSRKGRAMALVKHQHISEFITFLEKTKDIKVGLNKILSNCKLLKFSNLRKNNSYRNELSNNDEEKA